MILAGAGSGKTRNYHSPYRLYSANTDTSLINFGLDFSNKAAGEMKQRIQSFGIPNTEEMWMGTFHSICARILRTHSKKLASHTTLRFMTNRIRKTYREMHGRNSAIDTGLSASQAREEIPKAKNAGVTAELFDETYGQIRTAKISAPFTEDIRKN